MTAWSGRPIDHVVIAVRDLDAAARAYEALGFTLTPRAQHPWGTANRLAQFEGRNFIELLEVDRPGRVLGHDPDADPPAFSFGAYNRDFIANGEGMSMLVLAGQDSRADVARFARAGLKTYAPFDFERHARLPDGSDVTVAFSLAFATHPQMQRAVFFTCHNRFPEHFWRAEYQRHPNGALAITRVFMIADEPGRYGEFFAGLTCGGIRSQPGGIAVSCGTQELVILGPAVADRALPGGARLDLASGPRLIGLAIEAPGTSPHVTPASEACGVAIEWHRPAT